MAIIAVTMLAYASSFDGVLVFDDEPALAANPHIRQLWPLGVPMSAPPDTTLSGRPIGSLSFAVNYALAPDSVWAYHAGNLIVHVLAALTLFGIVRRTLQTARMRDRFGRAATPLALAVALLWAVHPIQTGAVTYVVQRVESLMGLFYLLTLYCAIRADEGPAKAGPHVQDERAGPHVQDQRAGRHLQDERAGRHRQNERGVRLQADHRWWLLASVAVCALGMATKEPMASAPLMVVAWDYVFRPAGMRGRLGLYGGLASSWVILALLVAGGHRTHAVGFSFAEWPWHKYLLTQAGVIVHYLRLAIVPSPLVLDYDWVPARSLLAAAPALAAVGAIAAATAIALVRRTPIGFAGVWLIGILAPTSSVMPIVTEIAAEHRMYLPIAAVMAVVVLSVYALGKRAALAVVVAIAGCGVLTDARNRDYQSVERIWLDTLQKQPTNPRARTNYASILLLRGEYRAAESHLRAAVDRRPDFAEAHADLGVALCAQQRFDEGIPHLQRAIAIQPDYLAAHRDLGEAYAASGRLGPAAEAFERALQRSPDDVMLLKRTGWILATAIDDGVRDGARAVAMAERAVRLTDHRDLDALDTLAAAYAETGRFADAVAAGTDALAVARAGGDRHAVADREERLARYRAGTTIRE